MTAIKRYAVMSQVQQNIGIFINVMPGARRLRSVVMILIEPMIDDAPMMWMAKMVRSMPMPCSVESGGYIVQPEPGAPPGMKNEVTSRIAAGGSSQKLQLFIRAKAMSGAPIIIGIIQLAKPTAAGMIAPKIMMRPCIVVIELKNSGSTICRPGSKSSARIVNAMRPPTMNMVNENQRYRVPISLWLVVVIQRITPVG